MARSICSAAKWSKLLAPGPCRFFGLFGREPDFLVPLGCITKIGRDIILVDSPGTCGRSKREKRKVY